MAGKNKARAKTRIFMLVSLAMFAGSTGLGALRLYSASATQPTPTEPPPSEMPADQVRGYEAVLKREPDNQTALEGLVNAKLQMQDAKSAVAPLEKLVKLNPDRADYAALLAEVKQQASN